MEEGKLDMRWSLKELYPSFDSEEFVNDIERLKEDINLVNIWTHNMIKGYENLEENIESYIESQNQICSLYTRLASFCSLTLSADALNTTAQSYLEKVEKIFLPMVEVSTIFNKWIISLYDIDSIINSRNSIKEHEFYLREIIERKAYALSDREESTISKMKQTGSVAFGNLQKLLISTHKVDIEIEGKIESIPLTILKNFAFSNDKDMRKSSYEAELESYKKIEQPIVAALNGIKGEVITISNMRGYKSPLHYTLVNSRMDEDTLNSMMTAVKESLPEFRRYYQRKGEMLGHKDGMPYYDIFAPIGSNNKTYSYEEARDFIVSNFSSFSNDLGGFAQNAFEKGWIDAEPRNGKRGGAFCSNIHPIKESRILSTFNGSFKNVTTLAHELGHGYHGHILSKQSYLNSKYPMPIAETASLFCETLVRDAAINNSDKKTAFTILEGEINNSSQVIVDIYARFIFEKALFEKRKSSALSLEEIKETMIESQKKAFGTSIIEATLSPYAWINKPHYYYAERNFYNFPYTFGLLFAKGLFARYKKVGFEFTKEYDKLLSITGKASLKDIGNSIGIDITKIEFWRESLDGIKYNIQKFIDLSKDKDIL
ncbi:oligoendopeptidase F-like protein [Clostridium putrefaciens]|uniref:Oligoendopeptidase F-like protein n=1 Tax=Clostridium putrefaciens TaxID=99675 RepID=A0A381J8P2_9CLOT|nr:M3 family oligoendopeptidase [Clostridium putrefaciens]SUY46742.1 oligoendopeptidase F-like protein [Clostridium putrefaciens]